MCKKLFIVSGCIIVLNACNIKQPLYLTTENIKLINIGFKESLVKASIKLYNPNTKTIQLTSANINLFLQNRLFGKIAFDTVLNMPPLDTFYIPVTAKIIMKDLVTTATALLLKDSILIKLSGKVKAGIKGIYKNVVINYEDKQSVNNLIKDENLKSNL